MFPKSHIHTNYQEKYASKTRLGGATKCMYSWKTDHYLKWYYQVF